MYKNCTVYEKSTGNIFQGLIDTELEHLEEYPYRETSQEDFDIQKVQNQQANINNEVRNFLADTDWKVIRHRDQLNLGIETSLTSEEYIALLEQRQEARNKVMEVTL